MRRARLPKLPISKAMDFYGIMVDCRIISLKVLERHLSTV
jgi:hypothetical protein